jgi:hypothetical protein
MSSSRVSRYEPAPPLGPDQQQAGDVRAGDQQDDADRAHDDPQNPPDAAAARLFERPDVGRDPQAFVRTVSSRRASRSATGFVYTSKTLSTYRHSG